MTKPTFPSRITISDHGVHIDGKLFPYWIADPDTEGFDVIEASPVGGEDRSKRLVLKLMFVPGIGPDDTTVVDTRASQAGRRRELAKGWYDGWVQAQNHDSVGTPATFVTSDHEVGMAWRAGFNYGWTSDEQGWRENPYLVAGEGKDGQLEGPL